MLDLANVKSQRRIISGDRHYCQVTLHNGKTLDLDNALSDFPLEPDIDIQSKNKFLSRLSQKMEKKG